MSNQQSVKSMEEKYGYTSAQQINARELLPRRAPHGLLPAPHSGGADNELEQIAFALIGSAPARSA